MGGSRARRRSRAHSPDYLRGAWWSQVRAFNAAMGLMADVEIGVTLVLLGLLGGSTCVVMLFDPDTSVTTHARQHQQNIVAVYGQLYPSILTSVLVPGALALVAVCTAHKLYRTLAETTVATKASATLLAVLLPYWLLVVRNAEQELADHRLSAVQFSEHAATAAQGHRLQLIALFLLVCTSALDSSDGVHVKKMNKAVKLWRMWRIWRSG